MCLFFCFVSFPLAMNAPFILCLLPLMFATTGLLLDLLTPLRGVTVYKGDKYNIIVVNNNGNLALVALVDNPPQPRNIFPESEIRFFDLEGHTYELTSDELIWKIRGGKRTIKFKRKP